MRYIFEDGFYPNQIIRGELNLSSDDLAISIAKLIGADYLYEVPEEKNPRHVWIRGRE